MKELWFARSSHGYSGRGTKATGYEHHRVRVAGGGLNVEVDGVFKNFGVHRFRMTIDQKRKSTRFDYGGGEIVVDVAGDASGWRGRAEFRGERTTFEIDAPADAGVPSVAARLLPMTLPLEVGELATYAAVPEDGFPWWLPGDGRSWFPLVSGWSAAELRAPVTKTRTIVGRGEEALKSGRSTMTAFRYDHVDDDGAVAASTWVGEGGDVARYEQKGTVLVAVTQDAALALEPEPGA